MKHSAIFLLLAIAAMPSAWGQDKVYKWTDEQGVVHYGTQPPDQGAEEVKLAKSFAETQPPAEKAEAGTASAGASSEDDPCAGLRNSLATLENTTQAVAIQDGDQIRPINEAERRDQITVTRIKFEECEEQSR